jgi:hypothetical protein
MDITSSSTGLVSASSPAQDAAQLDPMTRPPLAVANPEAAAPSTCNIHPTLLSLHQIQKPYSEEIQVQYSEKGLHSPFSVP